MSVLRKLVRTGLPMLALVLLASCNKFTRLGPGRVQCQRFHSACCKLRTVKSTNLIIMATVTTTYTYDSWGRTHTTVSTTGVKRTFNFEPFNYPNKLVVTIEYPPPKPTETITYTLSNGLAQSSVNSNGQTATYAHDANGCLTNAVYMNPAYSDTRTITNGNVTTEVQTGGGVGTTTTTYTTIENSLADGDYTGGLRNHDMELHRTFTNGPGPIDFTYILDSYGRVSKQTRSGGVSETVEFTYY